MKPLTRCPGCDAPLIKKTIPEQFNRLKYENCSKRCTVDYFQYYKVSYDEPEVDYVSLQTPDDRFGIYIYYDHDMYKNLVHVYSNATTEKYGISSPILKLSLEKYPLDLTNIKSISDKISTLALFV